MTLIISLLFLSKLKDIHAQPNFFNKNIIKNINFLPNDFSIDIYLLLAAKKTKQKLIRFNVFFSKRLHGIGNNEKFLSKILHAVKIILSSRFKFFEISFSFSKCAPPPTINNLKFGIILMIFGIALIIIGNPEIE